MTSHDPNASPTDEALVLALSALCWTLETPARSDRLLALTGLDPDRLRESASDPATLAALLTFLEAHEPDLVACAAALGRDPAALVSARMILEGQGQ